MDKIKIPKECAELILSVFRKYKADEPITPSTRDSIEAVERWLKIAYEEDNIDREFFEYGLKMNIYLNVEKNIEDESNKGYYICECISKCLTVKNYVDFYMHSSEMNEDVENELNISATFYIKSTIKTESEVIEEFLNNVKDNITNIDKDVVYDESVTIQVHECFISE